MEGKIESQPLLRSNPTWSEVFCSDKCFTWGDTACCSLASKGLIAAVVNQILWNSADSCDNGHPGNDYSVNNIVAIAGLAATALSYCASCYFLVGTSEKDKIVKKKSYCLAPAMTLVMVISIVWNSILFAKSYHSCE